MGPEVGGEGIRSPTGVSDLVGNLPAPIVGASDTVDSGDFDFLLLGDLYLPREEVDEPASDPGEAEPSEDDSV